MQPDTRAVAQRSTGLAAPFAWGEHSGRPAAELLRLPQELRWAQGSRGPDEYRACPGWIGTGTSARSPEWKRPRPIRGGTSRPAGSLPEPARKRQVVPIRTGAAVRRQIPRQTRVVLIPATLELLCRGHGHQGRSERRRSDPACRLLAPGTSRAPRSRSAAPSARWASAPKEARPAARADYCFASRRKARADPSGGCASRSREANRRWRTA